MVRIFIALSIYLFVFLFVSCKNPVATLITDNNPVPGRRDYTWTVDTLKAIEGCLELYCLWGTDANNIWAVGPSYRNADCIWYYNGNHWQNNPVSNFINPACIWGSGKNNIWIGSTDAAFWFYDGSSWRRVSAYKIEGYENAMTQSMSGSSSNDIYAVGFAQKENGDYKGIIMHYDGKSWEQLSIPDMEVNLARIYYNSESDEYLIMGFIEQTNDNMIYLFDRKSLKEIARYPNTCELSKVADKIYLNDGTQKIYRYDKNKFDLFKDFTGTTYAGRLWGRSEIDFFTDNRDGIGHFNGTDLVTMFNKFDVYWLTNQCIIFENDFFAILEKDLTVSVHGKLK